MNRFLFLIILTLLTGCSNLSPAIRNAPKMDLRPQQVMQKPGHYKGSPVRWGGKIVSVENENDASRIQILAYPLNFYGRPQVDAKHRGRFVIESAKFLDPAVYEKDSEITVAGIFNGEVERKVGKKTLKLPLLTLTNAHLWPERRYCHHFDDYDYYRYRPYYRYGFGYRYRFRPFLRFYGCY